METFIIDHGIEALWTIVLMVGVAAYKCLAARVQKQSADQKALKDGTLALLRSDLIRNYDHYCHRGWIPLYATENVLELYAAYTVLGGKAAEVS